MGNNTADLGGGLCKHNILIVSKFRAAQPTPGPGAPSRWWNKRAIDPTLALPRQL